MIQNLAALTTFITVLQEGSFDRAAQVLNITQSAVSQRIRGLEEEVGTLLIIRETPCRTTAEGEKLRRYAQQIDLLTKDLSQELGTHSRFGQTIPIAVNVDSVATWFVPVIRSFHEQTEHMLDIIADDENHTINLLREGKVFGAVTTAPKPIQGCRIEKLGTMKYYAAASTAFVQKYFANGLTLDAFSRAPIIRFNHKDSVQHKFISHVLNQSNIPSPPCHSIPLPQGFIDAALMHLGWGMFPKSLIDQYLKDGSMKVLSPTKTLDEDLFWQHWYLSSPTLDTLTQCVKQTARTYFKAN